ncbi:MAG: PulJ/GspJ family protein [Phycisphaerales bacterium]
MCHPRPLHGFTLVELMVSVAITALLILAINQVFSSVSKAVRIGIGASEVLQNSRILGDQLERDFKNMVPPGSNGVLVIVNQRIGPVHILPTDDLNENGQVDAATESNRTVRSDQIMFIRTRGDAQPMVASGDNSYSNSTDATYAKVWYGHCLRTQDNGQLPANVLGANYTPGASGAVPSNHFASDWILGRQALFLQTSTTAPTHANGGWFDAPTTTLTPPSGVSSVLYAALADVAYYGLDVQAGPSANSHGCMVGGTYDAAALEESYRLWRFSAGTTVVPSSTYASRAYNYLYGVNGNSSGTPQRLMVNPLPTSNTYTAAEVAQMYPYLCGHVSDFVVEFAGDYNNDSKIDTTSGNITWYGIDNMPPTGAGGFDAAGTTEAPYRDIVNAGTDVRFIFRHGDSANNWPYLIRIRYRLVDSKGQIAGADGEPGRWFEQIMKVNR